MVTWTHPRRTRDEKWRLTPHQDRQFPCPETIAPGRTKDDACQFLLQNSGVTLLSKRKTDKPSRLAMCLNSEETLILFFVDFGMIPRRTGRVMWPLPEPKNVSAN